MQRRSFLAATLLAPFAAMVGRCKATKYRCFVAGNPVFDPNKEYGAVEYFTNPNDKFAMAKKSLQAITDVVPKEYHGKIWGLSRSPSPDDPDPYLRQGYIGYKYSPKNPDREKYMLELRKRINAN